MRYKCEICHKIYKYKKGYIRHMKEFGYYFKISLLNEYKQTKLNGYLDYLLEVRKW